jgi:hypothetical protein
MVLLTTSPPRDSADDIGGLTLTRFLGDARIPLDKNAIERGLRGMVVGRKNHYASRSKRGTEVAALFYSPIETAKLAPGPRLTPRRRPWSEPRCCT